MRHGMVNPVRPSTACGAMFGATIPPVSDDGPDLPRTRAGIVPVRTFGPRPGRPAAIGPVRESAPTRRYSQRSAQQRRQRPGALRAAAVAELVELMSECADHRVLGGPVHEVRQLVPVAREVVQLPLTARVLDVQVATGAHALAEAQRGRTLLRYEEVVALRG